MTDDHLIAVRDLAKEYLTLTALQGVSLDVARGESVGLLGSNGAGKSTLLHILIGLLRPDAGEARVFGRDPFHLPREWKERIGFVPEETGLPPWATIESLARLFAGLFRRWDEEAFRGYVEGWDLEPGQSIRSLSKGERRLAELALTFATRPELILLDEPFHGLDAVMRILVLDEIRRIGRDEGATIFYSSHILTDVERIAGRIVILRAGEIVLDRPTAELGETVEEAFVRLYGVDESGGTERPT